MVPKTSTTLDHRASKKERDWRSREDRADTAFYATLQNSDFIVEALTSQLVYLLVYM
jgi:hypothetical protein